MAQAATKSQIPADWRRLPPDDLAAAILQVQRGAIHKHLSEQEWRRLDRMRDRLAGLRKTTELNLYGAGGECRRSLFGEHQ
jgi:hypothetical protein